MFLGAVTFVNEIAAFGGHVTSTGDEREIDDARIAQFLCAVGERVRTARTRKGISRRILSEASGVSQRYLAQLENGEGNISIGLLLRIASALDFRIEWLLAREGPWNSELANISTLFRSATKQQREHVLKILDPKHPNLHRASRCALIGLRGAGKSTLGRLAASELGLSFLELNQEIEQASGIPVHEVFSLYGQEGYRRLESQCLERIVATHDNLILAVSGGIVSEPETFNYLLQNCYSIWLKAEPEEHMERVHGQGDERPMAGNLDAMAELRKILSSREVLYAKAGAVVNTSNATLDESLKAVVKVIRNNVFMSN